MGELIKFKRRNSQIRQQAEVGPGGAEILFFLGVRYERQDKAIASHESKTRPAAGGAGKTRGPGKRRA